MTTVDISKDYYSILGVGCKAKSEEITAAYRKLMLKWHPDKFSSASKEEQDEATKKAAEINEAYGVLSDERKRAEYDVLKNGVGGNPFGMGGVNPFGFGGFGFGGYTMRTRRADRTPVPGRRILIHVKLPFEDFFFGCHKTIDVSIADRCGCCGGCGTVDGDAVYGKCPSCGGNGMHVFREGNSIIQEMCTVCGGTGESITNLCLKCGGSGIDGSRTATLEFVIPKGTEKTEYIHDYRGVGNAGMYGGENGDVMVVASLNDDGMFRYRGGRIETVHYVNVFKAISGGTERVLTPHGMKTVMIPSEMPDGYVMEIGGAGLKGFGGNLAVVFRHDYPKGLSQKDMAEVTALAERLESGSRAFGNVAAQRESESRFLGRMDGERG